MPKITRTKEDWKKPLPPENFHVLIEKGTEPPFTGKFNKNKKEGVYMCCGYSAPIQNMIPGAVD
jgi:peptide-methionine (R)-S-oxide reductase